MASGANSDIADFKQYINALLEVIKNSPCDAFNPATVEAAKGLTGDGYSEISFIYPPDQEKLKTILNDPKVRDMTGDALAAGLGAAMKASPSILSRWGLPTNGTQYDWDAAIRKTGKGDQFGQELSDFANNELAAAAKQLKEDIAKGKAKHPLKIDTSCRMSSLDVHDHGAPLDTPHLPASPIRTV